jgi:hypothetical protein
MTADKICLGSTCAFADVVIGAWDKQTNIIAINNLIDALEIICPPDTGRSIPMKNFHRRHSVA